MAIRYNSMPLQISLIGETELAAGSDQLSRPVAITALAYSPPRSQRRLEFYSQREDRSRRAAPDSTASRSDTKGKAKPGFKRRILSPARQLGREKRIWGKLRSGKPASQLRTACRGGCPAPCPASGHAPPKTSHAFSQRKNLNAF